MNHDEITKKVMDIVKDTMGVDEAEIDSVLAKDLGTDQLDIVDLVMNLEEEFGIEIPDKDAERFVTVNDVVTYVEKKLKGEPQPAEKTFKIKWEDAFWAFGKKGLIAIITDHYKLLDKQMKEASKFSVEEISDVKKELKDDKEKPKDILIDQFDANLWAHEFVKIVRKKPKVATDVDTMRGWFANAIMAGYDHTKAKKPGVCKHCGHSIALRNPSGYCDHLYYPEYCKVCNATVKKAGIEPKATNLPEEIDPTGYKVDGLYMKIILTVNSILDYLKKRDKL